MIDLSNFLETQIKHQIVWSNYLMVFHATYCAGWEHKNMLNHSILPRTTFKSVGFKFVRRSIDGWMNGESGIIPEVRVACARQAAAIILNNRLDVVVSHFAISESYVSCLVFATQTHWMTIFGACKSYKIHKLSPSVQLYNCTQCHRNIPRSMLIYSAHFLILLNHANAHTFAFTVQIIAEHAH